MSTKRSNIWTNLQLSASGLFKYVLPFSGYQALMAYGISELNKYFHHLYSRQMLLWQNLPKYVHWSKNVLNNTKNSSTNLQMNQRYLSSDAKIQPKCLPSSSLWKDSSECAQKIYFHAYVCFSNNTLNFIFWTTEPPPPSTISRALPFYFLILKISNITVIKLPVPVLYYINGYDLWS